jgi:hypothetical protein
LTCGDWPILGQARHLDRLSVMGIIASAQAISAWLWYDSLLPAPIRDGATGS